MHKDIWIWVHAAEADFDEIGLGLIREARRLTESENGDDPPLVTAVVMGAGHRADLEALGDYGVDRVMICKDPRLTRYQGELFAKAMYEWVEKEKPFCILMAQSETGLDLAGRLGALLETAVATRLVDACIDPDGTFHVVRPKANGYLFEALTIDCGIHSPVLSFLPSVLTPAAPCRQMKAQVLERPLNVNEEALATHPLAYIEADPEEQAVEDADIVVAAGRGVGKAETFESMHALARVLGASVGGTRPVIDWHLLPFERQIGQTGKNVKPQLIINCGISGANEYTAGIEKSQQVIAINNDPRARIFRFADLGLIGDVHEILPLLVERLQQLAGSNGDGKGES